MKKKLLLIFVSLLIKFSFPQLKTNYPAADSAYNKKDFAKAIGLYTEILKTSLPDSAYFVYYLRAFSYYELNDFTNATSDVKKALDVNESNNRFKPLKGSACWLYARILSKQGKKEKSLEYLIEASKYIQQSILYSTIGFKQIQLKKFGEALTSLNRAILANNTNAYAFSNRGLVFLKLHDLESARADITRAILLDAKNPYAFKHSAMIYIELKDYTNACIELNKAKELGYYDFGNEADKDEVNQLLKKYCK